MTIDSTKIHESVQTQQSTSSQAGALLAGDIGRLMFHYAADIIVSDMAFSSAHKCAAPQYQKGDVCHRQYDGLDTPEADDSTMIVSGDLAVAHFFLRGKRKSPDRDDRLYCRADKTRSVANCARAHSAAAATV